MVPTNMVVYNRIKELVKGSVERWPSAYASGMLVRRYKAYMNAHGMDPYEPALDKSPSALSRWFLEKWIDIETMRPCGSAKSNTYYPTCRPTVRVSPKTPRTLSELTAREVAKMIKLKQVAKKRSAKYNVSPGSVAQRKKTI